MSSPNPPTEDEASPEAVTPRKASAAKKGANAKSTPRKVSPNTAAKIKSGPGARVRPRANTAKPPPTLLTDFLLGKQSPARLAADRQRRMSLEAVKAELRHEMKQSSVKKIQPPGGVRDRVKAWQKTNGAAMGEGDPDDGATEPTDVAFKDDDESVTEADRIRIKMRQKKRKPSKPVPPKNPVKVPVPEETTPTPPPEAKPPPKKRVISDEHWRKNRKSPPRKNSQKTSPQPLPKDFTIRNAANPSVSNKVKAWAERVEIPEAPSARSHRSSRSMDVRSHPYDTESDLHSDMGETASQVTSSGVTSKVTAPRSTKSADDGIRVKPMRRKKMDDDGIRVTPMNSTLEDDGIRVRPMSEVSSNATSRPPSVRLTRRRSRTAPSSRRQSPEKKIEPVPEVSEISQTETMETRTKTPRETSHAPTQVPAIQVTQEEPVTLKEAAPKVVEDPEPLLDTPTRRPSSSKSRRKPRPKSYHSGVARTKEDDSWITDNETRAEPTQLGSHLVESDLSSSLLAKSVADLPGEIPWGNSAFTELDLPRGGGPPRSRPKKAKAEPTTSFKGMKVFKKVMEEGKKIIHEINEPPRYAVPNNPPSIEKWLDNTVDPFVDKPKESAVPPSQPQPIAPSNKSQERIHQERIHHQEPAPAPAPEEKRVQQPSPVIETIEKKDVPAPAILETPQKSMSEKRKSPSENSKGASDKTIRAASPETERKSSSTKDKVKSPASGGLKRSRATRVSSSTPKSGGKRQLLGFLKEAFQGESGGHNIPRPKVYQSHEEREYDDQDQETYDWEESEPSCRQPSSRSGSPEEEERPYSDYDDYSETTPRMSSYRPRPPTKGNYELSTILSEGNSSAVDSELTSSDVSHSTITQSTVLTRDSEQSKHRNHAPGLKRRLTRHSDLVSVLSLPNDKNIPNSIKSHKSRPSLRKNRGRSDDVTNDDLLKEFAEDENLYQRELKTLVDGVIPVLLSQVVDSNNATGFFGRSGPTCRADAISKSVVQMGVSLEKLKNAHGIAPLSDIRRLASWAHGVVPIYNKYLDAWRLGFQDLVVNLAPVDGRPEEEDSLLGAMPRNEDGDIIDSEGERVDVAHLLKRPILRVKQMTKFFKCVDSILKTNDTYDLHQDFEDLQEKARRRFREESARMIDEDASNTDTTRARDLRTLAPLPNVIIDPALQVSAKDFFSFDLAHSNGQRLECQVELIHRDNEREPQDKGDLLIRAIGDGRRSYLLLPPIPLDCISARTGDGNFDMVVMIRGSHNDRPWHELITLISDSEDQILDWLDILPVTPVPPFEPEPSVVDDEDEGYPDLDVPVGARGVGQYYHHSPGADPSSPASPTTPPKRALPSRYRPFHAPIPSTPLPASPESCDLEKTPTQDDYQSHSPDERSRPLCESMRPDPATLQRSPNNVPYREDGAPPPPVHRVITPSSQSLPKAAPSINPPVELQPTSRLKRRQSSPLKHEYLPSEGSTISGSSLTEGTEGSGRTGTESDWETGSESSDDDDEIESVDLPETEVGFSIREDSYEGEFEPPNPMESEVSASTCSLAPSNSASQAGLHGPKASEHENAVRYLATISRWSEKGLWKDICVPTCSVIVTPGLIEAYPLQNTNGANDKPLLSLDLTPLVLIRQSTAVDLEIRSSVRPECQLASALNGGNFRFRCHHSNDCYNLYMSVHHARLNNQKFIELENEARFKSFGERKGPAGEDDSSSHRRSWFGRKNSYRGSVRAPSGSLDGASTTPSSSLSASSFLKRLTGGGNLSFNLARSSVDRHSRAGSFGNSQGSSSAGVTTPRSPSVSVENSGRSLASFGSENIKIRLHLLVSAAKWEDYGNCSLQIRRPPPGWHQALRANHGLEKRVTVTTIPKKETDKPNILLDAVLGSGCFTPMGTRGIVCGVWEELKDDKGVVGAVPATGATGGNVKKWCFQCASAAEAGWVLRLVHQEVLRA